MHSPGRYYGYVLPFFGTLIAISLLKDLFFPGIHIILAIMSAPFVFRIRKYRFSYRYGFISMAFLLGYFFLNIHVFLFLSVGCFIFFTIECQFGKIGFLPFLFLICISSTVHYVVNMFTFSIRMELSRYLVLMLNSIGMAVKQDGTSFIMPDGYNFSVDASCVGLNMFNTGFSLAILMMAFATQRTNRDLNLLSVTAIFLVVILCLVLTNLLRIITLVLFRSEPGTISHDIIGIACLVVYMAIPVYFLIRVIIKKFGIPQEQDLDKGLPSFRKNFFITVLLGLIILLVSYNVKEKLSYLVKDEKVLRLLLPGYRKHINDFGIAEFRKDGVLIYVKPSSMGFESDHPPAICWKGSGFQISNVKETIYLKSTIFTAILKKDSIIQYTAWWYDNGRDKTISQWKWRFSNGESYRIINVTTQNKEDLEVLCKEFLEKKMF